MPLQVTIKGQTYTQADLSCAECGCFMVLDTRAVGGGDLHYRCSQRNWTGCKGTHSAHQADGRPMGIPGNKFTKVARMRAHSAFDQLWKSGKMKRSQAYSWLCTSMGMAPAEAHIGRFTEADCTKLLIILARQGIRPIERPKLDLDDLDM